MDGRRQRGRLALAVLLGTALALTAAALGIASASGQDGLVRLGASPRLPRGTVSLGRAPEATSVSGVVVLRPRDPAALQEFIAQASRGGRYLARGQFAARFGPSAATVAAVSAQLDRDGLTVSTGHAGDGLTIGFSGSAGKVGRAFATTIVRYRLPGGRVARANATAPALPGSLAGSVAGIVGLDEVPRTRPLRVRRSAALAGRFPAARPAKLTHPPGAPDACHQASVGAATFGGLTDDQIAYAYGAFGLYGEGDTGAGVHIGVFEQEPFAPSDIEHFDACYFGKAAATQMAARLKVISLEGGIPPGPGADGEALLDVEDVSAMAPGADIDVYENPETPDGEVAEIAAMVDEDRDQIITSSYGQPCEQEEATGQPGTQEALNFLFQQGAAQGQTFLGAAGDNGSDSCEEVHREATPQPGQNPISTGEISSQPYVLGVGGTTITDAATQPAAEHVWNDGGEGGAGGGGISQSFAMPSWQRDAKVPGIALPGGGEYAAGASVEQRFGYPTTFCDGTLPGAEPNTPCRLVPDVSAQADEYTGAVTVYSEEYRGGEGFESSPTGWVTSGGTSSATPIWAGMLALADASPTCRANPATAAGVGFVPPLLYAIASEPSAYAASFNDIVEGNIDQYDLDGGRVYPAHAGYDLASGLGSPRMTDPGGAAGLAYYLCSYAAGAGGGGTAATVTGLSPSSGPTAGGETIVVSGTGFEGVGNVPDVAGVQVGAWHASSFHVNGATSLSVTLPPARDTLPSDAPPGQDGAGPAQVIVTLADGRSSATGPGSAFQYYDTSASSPVPTITGITPYGGSETEPEPTTILGSDFAGAVSVTFGGVPATSFQVLGDSQIRVTPPPYSHATDCAPLPSSGVYAGESAADDVCQAQVVVHGPKGASAASTILPPFEGAPSFEQDGALKAPAGCGCEVFPAVTEYDYAPAPSIASVSTAGGPARLASETGGSLVTIHGAGLNRQTLDYAQFDEPQLEAEMELESLNEDISFISGTEIQIEAPAVAESSEEATLNPLALPFSVRTLAGESGVAEILYAGIPKVSAVENTSSKVELEGTPGASDGGGTTLLITGKGLAEQVTSVRFQDSLAPPSLGVQDTVAPTGRTKLYAQTVAQPPALADVRACTVTGCSAASESDLIYLYPPGAPRLESLTPSSGPAAGGTKVTIAGANLGCPLGVSFGSVQAKRLSGAETILACATSNSLQAVAPAGKAGASVPVTVATLGSYFSGAGDVEPVPSFTFTGP